MNAMEFITNGLERGTIRTTGDAETLTIDGTRASYRIYEVAVSALKYNVHNGRIATYVSRHTQETGQLPAEGSEAMNDLIEDFITSSNPARLSKTKLDIKAKGQQRPAVVLSDGTIIDGNRRFTCMRKLQREENAPRYLRCFILDSELDPKSLKGLELEIQFGQDEKVSYDPVSRLVDIYEWCRKGDLDPDFYREKCGMTKSEMASYLGQADLLVEFLQFINANEQFHIAQDLKLQGPLQSLYDGLKKCPNERLARGLKVAAFASMLTKDNEDPSRHVRDICDLAKSEYGSAFLDEQGAIACDILAKLEHLPEGETVDAKYIEETVRTDSAIIQRQRDSFKGFMRHMNSNKVKESQVKEAEKALKCLKDIDAEVLMKLTPEALEAMKATLGRIENTLRVLNLVIKSVSSRA